MGLRVRLEYRMENVFLPEEIRVPCGSSDVVQQLSGRGDGEAGGSVVQTPVFSSQGVFIYATCWLLVARSVKKSPVAAFAC